MAWVLSNVSNKLIDNLFKFGSRCAPHFSGVVGRCRSVSAYPFPRSVRAQLVVHSTINGNAKINGADHTVNGYLIFISYSVALLARTSASLLSGYF